MNLKKIKKGLKKQYKIYKPKIKKGYQVAKGKYKKAQPGMRKTAKRIDNYFYSGTEQIKNFKFNI